MNNQVAVDRINSILKRLNKLVVDVNNLMDNINDNKDKKKCSYGSISYRKDGRYMGRFTHLGKTYYVYDNSKEKCANKLKQRYDNVVYSKDRICRSISWKQWIEYWWFNFKIKVIKESTAIIYEPYMKLIMNDSQISNKPISKINDEDLLAFISRINSNKQKKTCYMLLKDICSKAVRKGLMKTDASCFVLKLESNNQVEKKKTLTSEEIEVCKNYLANYNYIIYEWFIFCINTGLRIGESLALTWDDVDFDKSIIKINKAYNQTLNKVTIPKTENSFRIIPLFNQVKLLLLSINHKTNPIFDTNIQSIKNAFQNIKRNFGIKVTPHMLRHTFATICLQKNVNCKVVQKWLGHNSIQTTQDIYQHINYLNDDDTEKMNFDTYI